MSKPSVAGKQETKRKQNNEKAEAASKRQLRARSECTHPSSVGTWACAACTLENKNDAKACKVCGTKRQNYEPRAEVDVASVGDVTKDLVEQCSKQTEVMHNCEKCGQSFGNRPLTLSLTLTLALAQSFGNWPLAETPTLYTYDFSDKPQP